MKYEIDFHCHTIASDGAYTIPHLARIAKERGLGALVVTDHCYSAGSWYANKAVLKTMKSEGIELPVPVVVGSEIYTPFGEFLLFGNKAISNWYYARDRLKHVFKLLGATAYWKMFWDHVCCGGAWAAGGIDLDRDIYFDKNVGTELPYAMIMCHPGKSAEAYERLPDEMYKCLHGFEIGNSGNRWDSYPEGVAVVDVLRRKIKKPRELTDSDCHGDELGQMRNTVEIPDGKELNEGWLVHWLRNK